MRSKTCPICNDQIQKLPEPHWTPKGAIYESCYNCGFSWQREGEILKAAVRVVLLARWRIMRENNEAAARFMRACVILNKY